MPTGPGPIPSRGTAPTMAEGKGLEDTCSDGGRPGSGRRQAISRRRPTAIRRPTARLRRFDLSGLSLARRYLLLSLVFVVIGGGVSPGIGPADRDERHQPDDVGDRPLRRELRRSRAADRSRLPPALARPRSTRSSTSSTDTPLGARGRLLPDLVDRWPSPLQPVPRAHRPTFDMGGERGKAALGAVIGDISDLSDPENVYERQRWSHLIELYLPVRASGLVEGHRGRRVLPAARRAGGRGQPRSPDRLGARGRSDGPGLPGPGPRRPPGQRDDPPPAGRAAPAGRRALDPARPERAAQRPDPPRRGPNDRPDRAGATSDRLRPPRRAEPDASPSPCSAWTPSRADSRPPAGPATPTCSPSAARWTSALTDMRTIAAGLRTPELERATPAEIVRAGRRRARAPGGRARRRGHRRDPRPRPRSRRRSPCYRILSEALSNAARHGGGTTIQVRVDGRRRWRPGRRGERRRPRVRRRAASPARATSAWPACASGPSCWAADSSWSPAPGRHAGPRLPAPDRTCERRRA